MKEKSNRTNRIYSVCFLALMIILGSAGLIYQINNHYTTENNIPVITETVSLSELYPFSDDVEISSSEKTSLGYLGVYWDYIHKNLDKIEKSQATHNPLSSPFSKFIFSVNDFWDMDLYITETGSYIKLDNGYFASFFTYCPSLEVWNSILDFSEWLKSNNIHFVSLITPDKADDSVTEFPDGVPHGYTQMMDEYKAFMDEKDIYCVETKEWLLAENENFYSWFYKTDHHWNVQAAFLTAQKTALYLNDSLSVPSNAAALADDNYELVAYPDSFLGSYGKNCGYFKKETMEVYYPKSDSDFHIDIHGYGINKNGCFQDTLIDRKHLNSDDSAYCAFLYGDYPLIRIENRNCKNGTRILVIKHSFANSLCAYLADTVQYLDVIDPRHFDGSLRSFIEQTKPDAVLLCTGVPVAGNNNSFRLK